jgi:hypothetical protein
MNITIYCWSIRGLKRYFAREIYKALCRPNGQECHPCRTSNKIFQLRS